MSGRARSGRDAAPSGFIVLRTPLLPFSEVNAWASGLLAPMALGAPGLDEAVAADRIQLRRRLEDIVTTPEFRDALFVASPSLAAAVDPWRKEPDSDRGRATERSLRCRWSHLPGSPIGKPSDRFGATARSVDRSVIGRRSVGGGWDPSRVHHLLGDRVELHIVSL